MNPDITQFDIIKSKQLQQLRKPVLFVHVIAMLALINFIMIVNI
jgi:hypothetical protein